jgi:hypothetical protein
VTEDSGQAEAWMDGPRPPTGARRGSKHPKAVLTEATVRAMRVAFGRGWSVQQLAKRYRVSYHAVYGAVHRMTWKHVP